MKKLFIRCDSSSLIGVGHLSRMLVLAHQLQTHFSITFIVYPHAGHQSQLIIDQGFSLQLLTTSDDNEFVDFVATSCCDLVIIDHYGVPLTTEKHIDDLTSLIVIDDLFSPHHAKMVINPSFISTQNDYFFQSSMIMTGENSPLIGENFFSSQKFTPFSPLIKNPTIIITLGGADVLNLSGRSASIIKRFFPQASIVIITTHANKKAKWLKRRYPSTLIGVKNMANVLKKGDIIITSASTTLSETIALKKPFIAVACAHNQLPTLTHIQKFLPPLALTTLSHATFSKALNFLKFQPIHQQRFFSLHPFKYGAIGEKIINTFGET